jgi:hypothetical protein
MPRGLAFRVKRGLTFIQTFWSCTAAFLQKSSRINAPLNFMNRGLERLKTHCLNFRAG